jgi:hypothetical protein
MFDGFSGYTISAYPCSEELIVRKHHAPTPILYRRDDTIAAGLYDQQVAKWQDWAFAIGLLAARHRAGQVNEIACVTGPFHEYRIHAAPRLSQAPVSEYDATLRVVETNLEYFKIHYETEHESESVAREVLSHKPSRLEDLLHMAAYDLQQSLTVARERAGDLASPHTALGIA